MNFLKIPKMPKNPPIDPLIDPLTDVFTKLVKTVYVVIEMDTQIVSHNMEQKIKVIGVYDNYNDAINVTNLHSNRIIHQSVYKQSTHCYS